MPKKAWHHSTFSGADACGADPALDDVEDMARANRRELELQFQRMAQMQAELDKVKTR